MVFRANLKVCFSDIDNAGITYYPRMLHYFHVALEEFFADQLAIDYSKVITEHRTGFPTVHLETDFHRPLRYGDRLGVEVRVPKIGNTSITWGYRIFALRDTETLVVEGHNVTVCIDLDSFSKKAIPDWLKKGLREYQENCLGSSGVSPG